MIFRCPVGLSIFLWLPSISYAIREEGPRLSVSPRPTVKQCSYQEQLGAAGSEQRSIGDVAAACEAGDRPSQHVEDWCGGLCGWLPAMLLSIWVYVA